MRLSGSELVESREITPGTWLQAWHAPAVVSGARAGQYVHVRTTEPGGLPLRRPYPIATTNSASGVLTIQVAGSASTSALAWARGLRAGDVVDIAGPLGRPFEVDSRSRHLLLVAEGPGIAALRLLADEAIRDVRSVVLLYGATTASQVYPSSLLPDEVEYVVATADGSLGHPRQRRGAHRRLRGVGRPGIRVRVASAARGGRAARGGQATAAGCGQPWVASGAGDVPGARIAGGAAQELPPGRPWSRPSGVPRAPARDARSWARPASRSAPAGRDRSSPLDELDWGPE